MSEVELFEVDPWDGAQQTFYVTEEECAKILVEMEIFEGYSESKYPACVIDDRIIITPESLPVFVANHYIEKFGLTYKVFDDKKLEKWITEKSNGRIIYD